MVERFGSGRVWHVGSRLLAISAIIGIGLLFFLDAASAGAGQLSGDADYESSADPSQSGASVEVPQSSSPSVDETSGTPQVVGDSTTGTAQDLGDVGDGRRPVSVAGVEATWLSGESAVEVSALVTDYIGEGTCEISVTGAAGQAVVQDVVAVVDAQTTLCPRTTISVPTSDAWTVKVAFFNDSHAGASQDLPLVAQP